MKDSRIKYRGITLFIIGMFLMGFIYCGMKWFHGKETSHIPSPVSEKIENKDQEHMIAVVKNINSESITVFDINKATDTIFTYSEATRFINKYNDDIKVTSLKIGNIVDIMFDSDKNKAETISLYKDAWIYPNVSKMKIDKENHIIELGRKKYAFTDDIVMMSDEEEISMLELGAKDLLCISGIGTNIYSITVTKGHGYIRFINYKDFVGGTVSIGNSYYMSVSEEMTVTVREGSYEVNMSNGELKGTKTVTVHRDEESTVDMGKFKISKERIGKVIFNISPYGADLYINGILTDYSKPVSLNYGEHKIVVYSRGYKGFTGLLIVAQQNQSIDIGLVEDSTEGDENDELSESENLDSNDIVLDWNSDQTTSSSLEDEAENVSSTSLVSPSPSDIITDTRVDAAHKIAVQEPEGAEVYIDHAYKGVVPVSFTKIIGNHTITLKKSGCNDKTYQIVVADDGRDLNYTFHELEQG